MPLGSDVVVTVRAGGTIEMLSCRDAVAPGVSATWTVNPELPAVDGVPAIVARLSESPAGKEPDTMDQVYVPVPPLADSVCEYGEPTIPLGSDAVVTVSGAGATVMLSGFEAVVPAPSATWTVNPDVAAAEGVPEIVAPLSESPAGSEPDTMDQVYVPVPPLAASACEYGEPTIPLGSDAVVTVSGGGFTVMLSDLEAVLPALSRSNT